MNCECIIDFLHEKSGISYKKNLTTGTLLNEIKKGILQIWYERWLGLPLNIYE